jgi:hypothetical protein
MEMTINTYGQYIELKFCIYLLINLRYSSKIAHYLSQCSLHSIKYRIKPNKQLTIKNDEGPEKRGSGSRRERRGGREPRGGSKPIINYRTS